MYFCQNRVDDLILLFPGDIGGKRQGQNPAAKIGAGSAAADLLILNGSKGRLLMHAAGIVDHGGNFLPLQCGHYSAAFVFVPQQNRVLSPCGSVSLGDNGRAHFIPETAGIVGGGLFDVPEFKTPEGFQLDLQDGGLQGIQP